MRTVFLSPNTSILGCALLLVSACSGSSGRGSAGESQGGQVSATVPGTGGTVAGSGGTSRQTSNSPSGGQGVGGTVSQTSNVNTGGQSPTTGGQSPTTSGKSSIGGQATGITTVVQAGGMASGGQGTGGSSSGGQGAGTTSSGGTSPSTVGGGGAGPVSGCVGKAWPTANPTAAGPFEVAADKNVGPLAGTVPDPIYGDEQQHFNVYRPKNLAQSGYCHPILIWANGYTDNPEQNPPKCVVDSGAGKWCGQYLPMMNHLASHGFVVVASLSTATGSGTPLPTIVGMDWIIKQAEDSSSPYYHRLDTTNIGQLGHSFGGMSTCMSASDPRYKALATICGTRALTGVHTPMMFFCGGKDTTVACSGVRDVFLTVKDQPAFFINELNSDHGSWVYQGAKGVSLSSAAAWFRVHLMGDTANRKYFYGPSCTFCTDSRVKVEQNSLMAQ